MPGDRWLTNNELAEVVNTLAPAVPEATREEIQRKFGVTFESAISQVTAKARLLK